jgi:transposase
VVPYLTLMDSNASQRMYELREMFNALRWLVRAGAVWRMLPTSFPSWELVYQRNSDGCRPAASEAMVRDLRSKVRVAHGRQRQPAKCVHLGWVNLGINLRERRPRGL